MKNVQLDGTVVEEGSRLGGKLWLETFNPQKGDPHELTTIFFKDCGYTYQ